MPLPKSAFPPPIWIKDVCSGEDDERIAAFTAITSSVPLSNRKLCVRLVVVVDWPIESVLIRMSDGWPVTLKVP